MNLRIGTSGFSYKEWKGTFYPEELPASGDLSDRVDPARECVPGLVDSMCIYN